MLEPIFLGLYTSIETIQKKDKIKRSGRYLGDRN